MPGPCVVDVSEENILCYGVGDWTLIDRDLRAAFGEEVAEQLATCLHEPVAASLAVRRELINYKKLCLHMWQRGLVVEKDLRQLASFFYCDLINDEPPLEKRARYATLSSSMNECHGAVVALHDARYFGKAICNLPRHPKSGVPWKFNELPSTLEVSNLLEQARQYLRNHKALDMYWAARWDRPLALDANSDITKTQDAATRTIEATGVEKPLKKVVEWKSERNLVPSPIAEEALHDLLASVKSSGATLTEPALRYVQTVLIARGAAKAFAIRSILKKYTSALERVEEESRDVAQALRKIVECPSSKTSISAGLHLFAEKYLRVLKGSSAVITEMLRWLKPISDLHGDSARLFVSGSRGATAFVPHGFADILSPYRILVGEHRGSMMTELANFGWPKSARPRPEEEVKLHTCRRCGDKHTKLWLHRELCFSCEEALRSDGRCPYNTRCGAASFCVHARRCVVCEQWSCEACCLLRGDGEDVWQLVGQAQPAIVFLDFDRTLATTKAGASPLDGNHSIDSDLAAVCRGHSNVQIVTRSSRREEIGQFLSERSVPISKVHCLKRDGRKNKSEVILEELSGLGSEGGRALFVDDDIRELTNPALSPLTARGILDRVLFVRTGGRE